MNFYNQALWGQRERVPSTVFRRCVSPETIVESCSLLISVSWKGEYKNRRKKKNIWKRWERMSASRIKENLNSAFLSVVYIYITAIRAVLVVSQIPEKNCAISSFEQPNGRPRNLTQPSSIAFSKFRPLLFTTHSISPRFALNTETKQKWCVNLKKNNRQWNIYCTRTICTICYHNSFIYIYIKKRT